MRLRICEAVTRPSMRFVPIKTKEQQAALIMHRTQIAGAPTHDVEQCEIASIDKSIMALHMAAGPNALRGSGPK